MNRPTCKTCVHFDVDTKDLDGNGICKRFPEEIEVSEEDFCGEHDQFKKWYSFKMQNQFRVDVESVKTKAELDALVRGKDAPKTVTGASVSTKMPLKVHESLEGVDTSGVQTKEETGEPVKAAATMPALGTEICAECNETIVNQTCKCGKIH